MSLLTKEINIFFSSDENSGAENVSADGSRFSVILDNPIKIPSTAINCTLGVISCSIWNTSPNISLELQNNQFKFTTTSGMGSTHTITISDGLYSVGDLNSYLSVSFLNLGLPSNLFVIGGVSATGQSIISYLLLGDSVDFSIGGTIRTILGFDSAVYTSTIVGQSIYSQDISKFNRNNSYLILSDIISGGIPLNSITPSIIASVPITVAPGSQINYTPFNITEIDANLLINLSKSNVSFSLTNQALQPTPTQGEIYTLLVRIRYTIRI